jgi:exoribonuclease R
LDDEARKRANTIYLVERAIPMLPRILSERLCSINVGSDCLAFSVLMEVNPKDGSVVNKWFGKTVIRTCAQLAYEQAQEMIDKDGDLNELKELEKKGQN